VEVAASALTAAGAKESGNAHLSGWARSGYVQVTDGDITDFDVVAEDLRSYCRQFEVQEIAFDPALSMYFAGKLVEEGLPLVEIAQRALFFTPPLIQVENLVLEGKLRFDGNPVFTWMMSNVQVSTSKFNGLKHPTKAREENKIDGPVALYLALGRAMAATRFEGKAEQQAVVLAPHGVGLDRVVLLGIGKADKARVVAEREAAEKAEKEGAAA
jgi:phage terminase large subunit-like protein